MNKLRSRGFTLIELLVVIAIIGILSAVVLASLSTARTKGQDAAIQSDLNTIQTEAEIFYNGTGSNSYTNLCTTDTTIANAVKGINSNNGAAYCASSATAYAAQGKSQATASTYYCVDSTGKVSTSTTALSGSVTACS